MLPYDCAFRHRVFGVVVGIELLHDRSSSSTLCFSSNSAAVAFFFMLACKLCSLAYCLFGFCFSWFRQCLSSCSSSTFCLADNSCARVLLHFVLPCGRCCFLFFFLSIRLALAAFCFCFLFCYLGDFGSASALLTLHLLCFCLLAFCFFCLICLLARRFYDDFLRLGNLCTVLLCCTFVLDKLVFVAGDGFGLTRRRFSAIWIVQSGIYRFLF